MSRPSLAAVLVLATSLVAAAGSAGAARPRVAILEVAIEGDAPPELRDQLDRSLAGGLYSGGFEVVGRDVVRLKLRASPELVGCTTTTCLERVGELVGARRFARARVDASGASYTIELELLGADVEGGVARRVERNCAVCTIAEANDEVSRGAAELGREPPAAARPIATPVVAPPASAPIAVVAAPAAAPASRFAVWKWAAAGGAVVAVGVGVWMIAVDGDPTCSGSGECPRLHDTLAGGIGLTTVGAGLAGLTGWMFMNDGPRAETRAALVPRRDGAAVVVAGTF